MRLTRAIPFLLAALMAACAPEFDSTGPGQDPLAGVTDEAFPPAGMKRPGPKPEDVTVEMIQQKVVTCVQTQPSYPYWCIDYDWTSNPNGFQDCGSDHNTYDGEVTFHTNRNYVNYCIWAYPNTNHTTLLTPTMNDWDGPTLPTWTMRSRLYGGGTIYSGQNYGGSYFTWLGPLNGGPAQTNHSPTWQIRSGAFNN